MKGKPESAECYGAFEGKAAKCRNCEFRKSCAYYTDTEKKVESLSKLVSIDNTVGEWLVFAEESTPELDERREELVAALTRVLRWILSVDNYSLSIAAEIIAQEKNGSNGSSVAQLARARGVSRQTMHEKMVRAVAKHPELADLFQTSLRKVANLHSQFKRLKETRKRK